MNAGAMFCEHVGEQNHEAMASPRRRKPTGARPRTTEPDKINKSFSLRRRLIYLVELRALNRNKEGEIVVWF